METVKIYTTNTCPYCFALADWLDDLGVKYETIDAATVPGITGVPVTRIGDTEIVGFDRPALTAALKTYKIIA